MIYATDFRSSPNWNELRKGADLAMLLVITFCQSPTRIFLPFFCSERPSIKHQSPMIFSNGFNDFHCS